MKELLLADNFQLNRKYKAVSIVLVFYFLMSFNLYFCTIWYHLRNLKNVEKSSHGGVLFLLKLQASSFNFIKSNTPPWAFSRFLNFTNGTKLLKVSHMFGNCQRFSGETFSSKNVIT